MLTRVSESEYPKALHQNLAQVLLDRREPVRLVTELMPGFCGDQFGVFYLVTHIVFSSDENYHG